MPAILRFDPSGSPDVVSYTLFYAQVPSAVTFSSPFVDLGNPPLNANDQCEIDLSGVAGMSTMDGVYNLGLVAVDDAGNLSSMLTEGLAGVALDFVAPDPPTNASVSSS